MKVLELFGGIGAPRKALERLGIECEVVDYVEIDKYAVKSYNAIYGENYEPQDVTKWDRNIDVDLIFHGSPCQDFSIAGKGAGGEEDSGTRSSLMWHTVRIVEKLKPKYVIWENVKAVISKKHIETFDKYLEKMENLGYTNYYQVLNAKDYGIPQNRERVFTVSVLKEPTGNLLLSFPPKIEYKKINFTFPPKQELKLRLKDMLEDEVDEKYYLKNINEFVKKRYIEKGYIPELFNPYNKKEIKNIAPTQSTQCGSTTSSCAVLYSDYSKKKIQENISRINGKESGTITANAMQSFNHDNCQMVNSGCRIRKLTPLECWRLMGFDDEDFYKAEQVNSNSQLYKQAGNSIVVNVLETIFKELF